MPKLVQIVPRFPPRIDGVGDFAQRLGIELQERHGVRSEYLVADPNQKWEPGLSILKERTRAGLAAALRASEANFILLHYSGYGYDERGRPEWLAAGLEDYSRTADLPLHIFFHEVWSSGPVWTRPFYSRRAQERLARRLHGLAARAFTSAPKMKRLLVDSGVELAVLPIPGPLAADRNCGNAAPRLPGKGLKLAVFGQEHSRARSLRAHARLIRAAARAGRLEALVLVGKSARADEADGILGGGTGKAIAVPDADPGEIREQLCSADALLSFYPWDLLTKSSAAMAACACGCPVVLPAGGLEEFDPPPPYLNCDGSAAAVARLLASQEQGGWHEISARAREWHERHASWEVVTNQVAAALGAASMAEGLPMKG